MKKAKTEDITKINCPKCGTEITITEALMQPIAERERKKIEEKVSTEMANRFSVEIKDLQKQVTDSTLKI